MKSYVIHSIELARGTRQFVLQYQSDKTLSVIIVQYGCLAETPG